MKRIRFDIIEVAGILLLAVMATSSLQRHSRPAGGPHMIEGDLLADLQTRFGSERYSQGPEEWLIRDFFNDRRNGVFLDVGAFHPVTFSNSYRLERDLGWTGVAIDALKQFAKPYAEMRPKSRFFTAFVGDSDAGEATLHVDPEATLVASGDAAFTAEFTSKAIPIQVRRRTLDSILREAGVTKVDFVSLDIDLGEPAALKGFSLADHQPELLCIEAHAKSRQAILDIMTRAGYVVVGRYLRVDVANLYFSRLRPHGVDE
jgi:FkbM family methyltransferase